MTNEQIKQAYVVGKAAKGVLRYRYLQKQAMMKQAGQDQQSGSPDYEAPLPDPPNRNSADAVDKGFLGGYGVPTLTGSAVGSILGALIQAARGKDVLSGLLVGGGLGGLGGAGYQAYSSGDYKKLFPDNTPSTTQATPESNV